MLIRARSLGALGFDAPTCQSWIAGQTQYVPPTQQYRDSAIAACRRIGFDVAQAPGLLPAQFVFTPANQPAENIYYGGYKEQAAQAQHGLIAINPDTPADVVRQLTTEAVYQGPVSEDWIAAPAAINIPAPSSPATTSTTAPAAIAPPPAYNPYNPVDSGPVTPAAPVYNPVSTETPGTSDPFAWYEQNGLIVAATPLTPQGTAAPGAGAEADAIAELQAQLARVPVWAWALAAAGAAYFVWKKERKQ